MDGVRARAVVFDLWNTLVPWPVDEATALRKRWAEQLGATLEQLDDVWYGDGAYHRRETSALAPVVGDLCEAFGGRADPSELVRSRVELTRRTLVPDPAVLAALVELRGLGVRLGLISNCAEDVAIVWPETVLAPLFDNVLFSAVVGCMKPARAIYELACDGLGVTPDECVFVGDGANDELRGAKEAGLRAVLIAPPGHPPAWPEVDGWAGPTVASVTEVLELVA
jgi:putative hydrolase of the HAD superfamily